MRPVCECGHLPLSHSVDSSSAPCDVLWCNCREYRRRAPEKRCWSGPDLDRAYRGDLRGAITTEEWLDSFWHTGPKDFDGYDDGLTVWSRPITPTPAAEPDAEPAWTVAGYHVRGPERTYLAADTEAAEELAEILNREAAALNRTSPTTPADVQAVVDAAVAWRQWATEISTGDLIAAVDALLAKEETT